MQTADLPSTVRTSPATSCTHPGSQSGADNPGICQDCLAYLEAQREAYVNRRVPPMKHKRERSITNQHNQVVCCRHTRERCQLCDPPLAYGRRCVHVA